MHHVRDWLVIGTLIETEDRDSLLAENIGAMLQLHHAVPQEGIESLFIPIEEGYNIYPHDLAQALDFVAGQHAAGKRIMVACGSGISRSVTLAVAALRQVEGVPLKEAFTQIYHVHERAMPDEIHWKNLCAYFGEEVDFWDMWRTMAL